MSDNESKELNIPVLKDVVIPVVQSTKASTTIDANDPLTPEPSLLSSTLQTEIDTIISQAQADFDATIAQLLEEMQQRVERELGELHVQLTSDD